MTARAQQKVQPAPGRQTAQSLQCARSLEVAVRYLLFLPQGYQPRTGPRWPVMLFLHGAGERGEKITRVAAHGPPKIVATQPDFPFILISPQCPRGQHWSAETLAALLDHVLARHRTDPKRVYVTGLSMGGYAAWQLASLCPQRFAAVAPICGGGEILPILLAEGAALKALRSLPIWAFHGAKDPVVPVSESERMVGAFRKIGNEARLTIYPEAEHDSWTETYRNPALYSWFLSHRRRSSREGLRG